jgi:hypothetical protein
MNIQIVFEKAEPVKLWLWIQRRIYVNRIQNKNLQDMYASHTDLCSRDPSQDFQDETTVKVRRNVSFESL